MPGRQPEFPQSISCTRTPTTRRSTPSSRGGYATVTILFGSLPDTIEDEWIQDIENLDEYLSQFTEKKRRANAFDLRYGQTVMPEGPGWELCEKVLARRDVIERLSEGW